MRKSFQSQNMKLFLYKPLGAHLAMLWEDPGRLTPDAMEWLKPAGE
jgi:hypothetical protein